MTLKSEANFKLDASNLAKYPLCVILSVVETRGGLRRVEDSEGEAFCERLGSKKRLSIALVTVSYILRAVCGDNASLARLKVRENTVLPYGYVKYYCARRGVL